MSSAADIVVTGSLLGVVSGMRHALEPDHIAAVSTLMTEQRHSRGGALFLGACWGFGHSLSLLVVGVLLAALHAELPPSLALAFEAGVIVMLLALGLRALRSAFRSPQHRHGSGRGHGHGHDQPHEDEALRSHAHARQRRRFGGR